MRRLAIRGLDPHPQDQFARGCTGDPFPDGKCESRDGQSYREAGKPAQDATYGATRSSVLCGDRSQRATQDTAKYGAYESTYDNY